MDTSNYLFAAYAIFWLLPLLFIIRLFAQVKTVDKKLEELKEKLSVR